MDYIDKSDVFIIKLTGKKMYFTVNSLIFSIKCFKACCFVENHSYIW